MRLLAHLSVLILLVAIGNSAMAAPGDNSAANGSDEQRLRELTIEWMTAVANKNTRRLEQIMAPDYTLETPGALERVGRSEWIKNAVQKDWGSFRYDNIRVAIEDTQAVVTSTLHFRVSPIPVTLDSGVVDIWTKRDGEWRIKTRYLGASAFFTKVTFAAGLIAAVVLVSAAAMVWRLLRRRRTRLHSPAA